MHIDELQDFWWKGITGPHNAVVGVAESLLSNSTVVLKVPADLPWRHSMRKAIEEQIRNISGSQNTIITQIDVADECATNDDPGRYLLKRFAKSEVFLSYREKSGISIQNYMTRNNVLKDNIIWIKGVDRCQTSKWLKFCQGYKGTSVSDGCFVIEEHEQIDPTEIRNIRTIVFDKCVREYDLQLFNSFMLDEQHIYNDDWKRYISTVAASLCKTDAEVSALYIRSVDFSSEDPVDGIKKIADRPELDRRGQDINSTHVLNICRNGNRAELNNRVWEAQIQVLFPIIEMHRLKIISKLENDLNKCLSDHSVFQFGEQINDPFDFEFSTLVRLMTTKDAHGMRCLYVPDEDMRSRIRFLKECRNCLAHINCCDVNQVKKLIELS